MSNGNPDANAVRAVANKIPAVATLQKLTDTKHLKEYLDTIDPLCFPLLRWIVTSNRAHLATLESKEVHFYFCNIKYLDDFRNEN